jgi:aldehyde:ferredoxin oxidoreductase
VDSFFGKITTIDVTRREHHEESIPDSVYRTYLGGKGLGSYLLLKKNPPRVDPLSPDNTIVIAAGPACGHTAWGANRYAAFTKSPLTNVFSESYSGGRAFYQITKTGFDAIILTGKSEEWVYIEITPYGISFHNAEHLLGKDAFETETILEEQYKEKKAAVLTIGVAGENRVKYAYINNDRGRCLGRTGVGAVLGSKNVKALVFWGDKEKTAADPDLLKQFQKDLLKAGKEHPGTQAYKQKGTSLVVDLTTKVDAFPARYWQEGTVPHKDSINAAALHRNLDVKPKSCLYCFISCTREATVNSGRHKGLSLDGPEYETIDAFGGLNMVDDIREIAYLNDLCDKLGLDTVTAGNVTAFAIEAYKKGKIDFAIDYNDVDKIAELLHLIAHRQGIGDMLAEGVRYAAKELELEDIAIHVKGLEPPGYDPRSLNGMGLGYAVSDRGACHLRATFYKPELAGLIDPRDNNGKAELFLQYEDRLTIYDTLVLCRFFRDLVFWDELSTLCKATMGLDLGEEDFREIAASITDVIRKFNVQEGVTPRDDFLPAPFFSTPIGEEKLVLDRDKFRELVDDYYTLRGFK